MSKPYDLVIAYRVYPGVSKQPFIFEGDKYKLVKLGLFSLKKSLGRLHAKVIALLDGCPEAYEKLVIDIFGKEHCEIHHLNRIGNFGTFEKQVLLLLGQNDAAYIFFAEDDYYYLPGGIEAMFHFARKNAAEVDYVSPHDHLDYYQHPLHKGMRSQLKVSEGKHWFTAGTTCLTFLTQKCILKRDASVLLTYLKGNYDFSIWMALTGYYVFRFSALYRYLSYPLLLKGYLKCWWYAPMRCIFGKRRKLWIPVTAAGTHMQFDELGPNVNWIAHADATWKECLLHESNS